MKKYYKTDCEIVCLENIKKVILETKSCVYVHIEYKNGDDTNLRLKGRNAKEDAELATKYFEDIFKILSEESEG